MRRGAKQTKIITVTTCIDPTTGKVTWSVRAPTPWGQTMLDGTVGGGEAITTTEADAQANACLRAFLERQAA